MFAMAGAVSVVIGALVVWPSNEPASSISVPAPGPRVAQAVETVTPQPASPAAQTMGRTSRVPAVAVAAARGRANEIDLPEVVIAQNEVAAYTSLVASIRQRRFEAAVPVAPDPNQPLEVKELPPVEPIEIEPIVKLAGLE
jgi:hypothetical protein